MDKQRLRQIYSDKRSALKADDVAAMSIAIAKQFSTLSLQDMSFIHLFYPMAEKREVDSLKIAEWLRINHSESHLVLSRSNLKDFSLTHVIWDNSISLAKNRWGITEPVSGKEIDPIKLDMILIPLLAYDTHGNRVGYGKGFYDKFLSGCRSNARKVGLSFFGPEDEIDDPHSHDIKLDMCVTPQKIWTFK